MNAVDEADLSNEAIDATEADEAEATEADEADEAKADVTDKPGEADVADKRSEAEANEADEAKATEANKADAMADEADAKADETNKAIVADLAEANNANKAKATKADKADETKASDADEAIETNEAFEVVDATEANEANEADLAIDSKEVRLSLAHFSFWIWRNNKLWRSVADSLNSICSLRNGDWHRTCSLTILDHNWNDNQPLKVVDFDNEADGANVVAANKGIVPKRSLSFAIAAVVDIASFWFLFSSFCSTMPLPFTPSQNILQSLQKWKDILE